MSQSIIPYVEINPTGSTHNAVVIWLHGLGDSGNGFAPIVPQLSLPEDLAVRFVFPHAPVRQITINNNMPMRAWYDINSLDFKSRADKHGVKESALIVERLIQAEMDQGIAANRIVLAGFSQGGVIALHLGTRFSQSLAGIIALSTYISEPGALAEQGHQANHKTPIFMGHGQDDDVVPMYMGKAARAELQQNNYLVEWQDYPMQHNVCNQELKDISRFLTTVLAKTLNNYDSIN